MTTLERRDAAAPPARSIWLVSLYYTHGWAHGAHLRTFAVAREWVRRGATVHFAACEFDENDPTLPQPYLEGLRAEGVITDFDRIRLRHPWLRGKLARAALHPAARDVLLGPERRGMVAELETVARRVAPEAFVFTDPHLLFAGPHLRRHAPVTIDWKDSHTLSYTRARRTAAARGDWRTVAHELFRAREATLYERFYGRRADHNLLVSPVDAGAMARVIGSAAAVHTVPNGMRARPNAAAFAAPREPARLIFTGSMSFGPNHEAAVWFIRHVLPRVVARRPEARFVVAGSNPQPELLALAGPHVDVSGWVDDMQAELSRSALYVAPMISGSGFKNKVVEALAAGTNVVGTGFAFEFLPDRLRTLFRGADTPDALANEIIRALDDPAGNASTVSRFWELAGDEFEWTRVAERFAEAVTAPRLR